jgi:hypothetical protein
MSKTTNVIIDIFNQENNLNNSRNCTCETETIEEALSFVQCQTFGSLKLSNPTPEGDEVCKDCGDREMLDYEPSNSDFTFVSEVSGRIFTF